MEAGVGLTLEVLAFHFRSPVNHRSFGFGGYAFSHIGGPEVIPASGMARGPTYPVAPEKIIVAAKSLFTCFRITTAHSAYMWPLVRRAALTNARAIASFRLACLRFNGGRIPASSSSSVFPVLLLCRRG